MFEDLRKAIIHACGGMTREEFDTTLKDLLLSNRVSVSKELDLLLPASTLVSICDYDAFPVSYTHLTLPTTSRV